MKGYEITYYTTEKERVKMNQTTRPKTPVEPRKTIRKVTHFGNYSKLQNLLDTVTEDFPGVAFKDIDIEIDSQYGDYELVHEYDNPNFEEEYQKYLKDMIIYLNWEKDNPPLKNYNEEIGKLIKQLK